MRKVFMREADKKHIIQEKGNLFPFLFLMIFILSQIETVSAGQTLGGVVLTEVTPRIVTPNGDLLNDVIFFKFDNALSGLPVESSILDIHGARVSGMSFNTNETSLLWDGKDESGRSLPSGIYIYSIKIGKNQATGTVVVAR